LLVNPLWPPEGLLIDTPEPIFQAMQVHRHTAYGSSNTGGELEAATGSAAEITDQIGHDKISLT
jgi:hypothetical protein